MTDWKKIDNKTHVFEVLISWKHTVTANLKKFALIKHHISMICFLETLHCQIILF